jgi:hypothetical protein
MAIKLPKMRIYSKFVGSQRYAEQFILEKMRQSKDFNMIMKVLQCSYGPGSDSF